MGIVSLKYHQYIGCTGNMASRLASEGLVVGSVNRITVTERIKAPFLV